MRSAKFITAIVALSLPGMAMAQTANECIPADEASGLIMYIIPDVITGVAEKCKAGLPDNAFLKSSSTPLIARYQEVADKNWPAAKTAFLRIAGKDDKMMAKLPDSAIRPLLSVGIAAAVTDGLQAENCSSLNRIVESLAPLPPQNMGTFLSGVLEMVESSNKPTGSGPFKVCPAPLKTPAATK